MTERRILGLVGSPRANSTSEMLANHLTGKLAKRDWQADVQRLAAAIRQPARWPELEAQIRAADVVVLAFPLYVDSLPAEMTMALEKLAVSYRAQPPAKPQRWLGIINCGFLEAHQNDIALAICEEFCREAGVIWSGGLAIGGGGAIGGRTLEQIGGMVQFITDALAMTADALDAGREVPPEALALIRKRSMPPWLYFVMANIGMCLEAKKHHCLSRINAQPYARAR